MKDEVPSSYSGARRSAQLLGASMRLLASLLHLLVTAWVAYIFPGLLLGGLVGYFPGFPEAAHTGTYVALALGTSFLGGTILGRTRAWRGRVVFLSVIVWLLAAAATVPTLLEGGTEAATSADFMASMALDLPPLLLALGLTIGLYVGARFMRPFDRELEPPAKSVERTHER